MAQDIIQPCVKNQGITDTIADKVGTDLELPAITGIPAYHQTGADLPGRQAEAPHAGNQDHLIAVTNTEEALHLMYIRSVTFYT